MRITLDISDLAELEALASEATSSHLLPRQRLGHELQTGIVAHYRRSGARGYCIVGGKLECARCDAPVSGGCSEAGCPLAPRHAELPADRELLRRVHGRPFYTLRDSDVGKALLRAFGRTIPVSHFIGQIMPIDVGKRVYDVNGIVQVENEEQRGARLKAQAGL